MIFASPWPEPRREIMDDAAHHVRTAPAALFLFMWTYRGWYLTYSESRPVVAARLAKGGWGENTVVGAHAYRETGEYPPYAGIWRPPTADIAWVAASMMTAAIHHGTADQPIRPVAYKTLRRGGIVRSPSPPNGPRRGTWTLRPPQALMPLASCNIHLHHEAPTECCQCGYHAAYSPSALAIEYVGDTEGILVCTPVGTTYWHKNAWRARQYQVHAAVTWEGWTAPEGWDKTIPAIRTNPALIPWRAREIGREIAAMCAIEEAGPPS